MKIAPSILSADFAHLALAVEQCEAGSADYIHVDVMDGHFVPVITIGPDVAKALHKRTDLPLDVHLMIENPDNYIDQFAEAGSNIITVHVEACVHLQRTLSYIKEKGVKAGVSLNPATPLNTIQHVLDDVDLVLIMSVNPGFGGQKFIPDALNKIKNVDNLLRENGNRDSVEIEVDGGVKLNNAIDVLNAGADVLVAGSAIFGTDNPPETIKLFKQLKQ